MSVKIIQERLNSYACQTEQEEENALREITQEIALAALSRAGFFKEAAFQGGTCLRVLYGLERFSEDIDFALQAINRDFKLEGYLKNLAVEFQSYGYQLEIQDRQKVSDTVKKVFLKDDSVGKLLIFKHSRWTRASRKIRVKLEIDTNPPEGSQFEVKFLDFPFPFPVTVHDLPTLFAGKSHALLCREYVKGRDWYDFVWYTSRKTPINFKFLASAIFQQGPCQNQNLNIDQVWYCREMENKIRSMDWERVKEDVKRFLKKGSEGMLEFWNEAFFLERLNKWG
ncbi:MAG: nucleotidyl transferase AbiEii/AbiGii toxin family protein [Chlamydiae bacterium]|nr:nucleotidyl transferase AbiEii/AbiGii toxin family protein [Chlamydiota bacterium]MBI3278049.1 nucleotidyl transferase AbiEii/AbiGii toxin family protein [Chlamydiota bacterium]